MKMRILHFVPVYKPAWKYGGPVRSVSQLCEALAEAGIEISVITTNANYGMKLDVPVNVPVVVDGVQVTYFDCNYTPWGIDSFRLRSQVKRIIEQYDLVHMSSVWQPLGIPVIHAARSLKIPYIYTLRGTINSWAWRNHSLKHQLYWRLFERRLIENATAIHVTSDKEYDDALALGVGSNNSYIKVANGIRASDYSKNTALAHEFRSALNISSDKKIILFFGRVHPKKGIDITLRSAATLLSKSDEWRFVIVGPDYEGYRQVLRKLVNELGIASKVIFHETVKGEMRIGAYSAADIFVLTSHNENFGMSVVEAMASSVPVLISTNVGISKEIAYDDAGVVVDNISTEITHALSSLMNSEDNRRYYAQKGMDCVKKRYEIGAVTRQMIQEYEALLR